MRIEHHNCFLKKSLADSIVIIQRQNVTTPSQTDSSITRGRKAGVLLIKYEVSGLLQPIEDFQRPWILRTIVDDYEFAIRRRVTLNASDRVDEKCSLVITRRDHGNIDWCSVGSVGP